MKLVLASNNRHKVREIKEILGSRFDPILSLSEAGICHETVEDGETFLDNALKKAREIASLTDGAAVLADDSGLSVDALNGAPGVFSARYAGVHGDDRKNNEKLLAELAGVTDRRAHFVAAVALVLPDGREVTAEGRFDGTILTAPRGKSGFGYDPLFLPDGGTLSVAEMGEEEKNAVSHRSAALKNLLEKL